MRKIPVFFAILFLTVLPASATTYYVNPHPESTISISIVAQQLITAETITAALAKAEAGDTILVAAGTCATRETFPLTVAKERIMIRGAGAASTEVQGESGKEVFIVSANNVSIEALAIKNGTYGIKNTASNLNVQFCAISGTTQDGINVSGATASATLKNLTVLNCSSGVSVEGAGASAQITNSIIFNNSQIGLSATPGATLTSNYNDVFGNGANYTGVVVGTGDISRHPALNDNFALKPCSPAIDAGEGGVDMGAVPYADPRSTTIYVGPNHPVRTDFTLITSACATALPGDTISVAAEIYNQSKGETFPIEIPASVSLIGSGGLRKMVYSPGYVDGNHTLIEGPVKLNTGSTLESVDIASIGSGNHGVSVSNAKVSLKDLIISGEASAKSGIQLGGNSEAKMANVLISGFTSAAGSEEGNGILSTANTIAAIENITLTKNRAGIRAANNSNLDVKNSIIASNETFGIYASDNAQVTVSYSDIWGNLAGDVSSEGSSTVKVGFKTLAIVPEVPPTSVATNPAFRVDTLDAEHRKYDFRLKSVASIPGSIINSPCIDSGDRLLTAKNRIDMGAFGGTDWDEVFVDPESPESYLPIAPTPTEALKNKIIIVSQRKEEVAQAQWLIDAQAAYNASRAAGGSGLSVFKIKSAQAPAGKNAIDICINLLNPAIVQTSGTSAQSVKAMIVKPGTTVRLTIFNLRGEQVLTRDIVVTSPIEKYEWNGVTDFGGVIPNGIYTFLAIADGKIIGSGPMTVMNSP